MAVARDPYLVDIDHGMTVELARAFNIKPEQARSVISQITPEFSWALEELSLSRGGLADLLDALGRHINKAQGNGSTQPDGLDSPAVQKEGNDLLAQMFNSKYKSRVLASRVSARAGLETDLVKKMLPAIAKLFLDGLGKKTRSSFGNLTESVAADDKFSGQKPLSVPGDDIPGLGEKASNPYGDLSDILRRGGGSSNGAPTGGYLWSIIREVLGAALGFQGRGLLGWIIRLIIYRWGWQFLQALIRSLFMGR